MKQIPLGKSSMVALVDEEDYAWALQWRWHAAPQNTLRPDRPPVTWYARRSGKRGEGALGYSLHREILSRKIGRPLLPQEKTDHRDHNGLNCCRDNLRLASSSMNQAHRRQPPSKSGFRGVFYNPATGKWQARIILKKKHLYAGSFPTAEEAALGYDRAAMELFGEFALLNFPGVKQEARVDWEALRKPKHLSSRGVSEKEGKFRVALEIDNKRLSKVFASEEEAAHFYDYHKWLATGDASKLNFPEKFIAYG